MNLEELKKQARKVLDIEASAHYELVSFVVKAGGKPSIDLEDLQLSIKRQTCEFAYRGGYDDAYKSETIVECRKTNIVDSKGRDIYITPNDITFVWDYFPGCVHSFDSGSFQSPLLA